MSGGHWAEIEDFGILWGMKIIVFVHRYLGRFLLPIFLYPVVAYYWLTNSRARGASRLYLEKLNGAFPDVPVKVSAWSVFKHFMAFAHSILDRVAAWTGLLEKREIVFDSRPEIQSRLVAGQGVMMVAAHMGCLEVCQALANTEHVIKLNVLVHTSNAERMNALLKPLNQENQLDLIEVGTIGPATTLALAQKISRGEVVVMVGDRVPVSGEKNTISTEFLGATAAFALGPWVLAHVLKCPVYTLFCLPEKNGYRIHCDLLTERVVLPRGNRSEKVLDYLNLYVGRMEQYCRVAPLQWFNFYPYWGNQDQS